MDLDPDSWVEVCSEGTKETTKVYLAIRAPSGEVSRYLIPNVRQVDWRADVRFRETECRFTIEGVRVVVRANLSAGSMSAADLLAEIAADKLMVPDSEDK